MTSESISLPSAIDFSYRCNIANQASFLLVCGWATLREPERLIFVDGETPQLPACSFFPRHDISEIYGPCAAGSAGFVGIAPVSSEDNKIAVLAARENEIRVGVSVVPDSLHGVSNMLDALFNLPVKAYELEYIYSNLLEPIKTACEVEESALLRSSRRIDTIFDSGHTPQYSLIISHPHSTDAALTQLLFLAQDDLVRKSGEVIYILGSDVDDALAVGLKAHAAMLGLQCRIVEVVPNISPATFWNLGASMARANQLVFMDGSAIPLTPGWLRAIDEISGATGIMVADFDGYTRGTLRSTGGAGPHAPIVTTLPNRYPLAECFYGGPLLKCDKNLFQKLKGFDPVYRSRDFLFMDFHRRLLKAGHSFQSMEKPSFCHLTEETLGAAQPADYFDWLYFRRGK